MEFYYSLGILKPKNHNSELSSRCYHSISLTKSIEFSVLLYPFVSFFRKINELGIIFQIFIFINLEFFRQSQIYLLKIIKIGYIDVGKLEENKVNKVHVSQVFMTADSRNCIYLKYINFYGVHSVFYL